MEHALRDLGRSLSRAWENLAEGWRELVNKSSDALTRFIPRNEDERRGLPSAEPPRWGLVAGEVKESGKSIVVELEIPGVEKQDCIVWIDGDVLHVRGEKRFDRELAGIEG